MKNGMRWLSVAVGLAAGWSPPVQAGEVTLGGYYQFRVFNADPNVTDEARGVDDQQYWAHQLQINMDMVASEKSHAHLRFRPIDGAAVEGANVDADDTSGMALDSDGNGWEIRQIWLETEAWGVGIKTGQMPLSLNNDILISHDTTGFGTIMLSKSFGDLTLVGADVRIDEDGNSEGQLSKLTGGDVSNGNAAGTTNDDDDDIDLYVVSLLGKYSTVDYQATVAHLKAEDNSVVGDEDNTWAAVTGHSQVSGVDVTGTVIYENGYDFENDDDSDWLLAVRLNGPLGFGSWKGYAFYSGDDYNNIVTDNPVWSNTWDMSGVGPVDLMNYAVESTGVATETENVWAIGGGLQIAHMGWNIEPHIDYMDLVEDDGSATLEDAWGGSLVVSTQIQEGTTLALVGAVVDPDEHANSGGDDTMHTLFAELTMVF